MMANDSIESSSSNITAQSTDKSLKEALSIPIIAITSTLLFLLMIMIILGNLMVIRTVYMTPKLHSPAFYFVVSLAVADFIVGFLVPVSLVYNITSEMTGRWMAGEMACDIWTFANIWFVCASLLNLCVVSWDRYVAVTSPLNYKLVMHGNKVKGFIAMVWSLSLVAGILYTFAIKFSKGRRLCVTNGLAIKLTIPTFVIVYVIPTLFLMFVNGKVLHIARKHRKHIQTHEVTLSDLSINQNDAKTNKRKGAIMNELKTFKTFVIVIGTFVVCWSPFFVLLILTHFVELPNKLPHVTVILFYVKSALNPMIYGTHNKELRTAAANSLKRRRCIKSRTVPEPDPNELPNQLRETNIHIEIPNKPPNNNTTTVLNNCVTSDVSSLSNKIREGDVNIPNTIQESHNAERSTIK